MPSQTKPIYFMELTPYQKFFSPFTWSLALIYCAKQHPHGFLAGIDLAREWVEEEMKLHLQNPTLFEKLRKVKNHLTIARSSVYIVKEENGLT